MKRALVMAVLTAALVVGVTVAEAKISKGTFAGKTSAKDPVGFKVNKSGKVLSFYYEGVHLTCSDGDEFDSPVGAERIQSPANVVFKVNSKRKFHIKSRVAAKGFGWDAFGKFKKSGGSAAGTLHVFATFNDKNEQDPNGDIKCETAEGLTWAAERR
jgi:hypothetical protein